MTVSTAVTSNQYAGNGSTTVFEFDFPIYSADELVVRSIDADGNASILTEDTDYTIEGIGEASGTVTMTVAPAASTTLDLRPVYELLQPSNIRNQGRFLAETHEAAFDRLTRFAQYLYRVLQTTLRIADHGTPATDLGEVESRKGKYPFFNATTGMPETVTSITGTPLSQSIFDAYFEDTQQSIFDVFLGGSDQDIVDQLIADSPPFKRTSAEIAASVTPVNYLLPEGHVERYGAWANSSTDFTTFFQSVAAVARNKPGLVIQFTPGRTYAVWPAGTGSTLFDLDGAVGITVEGNGALLSAGEVDSSMPIVFDLQTVSDVTIRSLRFTQTYDDLDDSNGAEFFVMRQGSFRIRFENCAMTNGRVGIGTRGLTTDAPRCDGITAVNCTFTNVYYPQNFQNSGDNYFARGIKTLGCGRGYFPWNVHGHDVEMMSQQGGPFHDVLFKVYADPAFSYNRLENMRLVYWSDGKIAGGEDTTSGAVIGLEFQQNTGVTTAAEISNIDIVLAIDAGVTPTMRKIFEITKFTSAGAVDTTTRGYTTSNVTLSGRVRGWQNGTSYCIDVFNTNDGYSWTGESAINIKLCNLFLSGTSGLFGIVLNGQPFNNNGTPGIILENVYTEMRIDRNNWNEQKAFDAVNVVSSTIFASCSYQTYTPTWSGSGGASTLGNGSIVGFYTRRGDRIKGWVQLSIGTTSVAGAGSLQISLPAAAASGEGEYLGSAILFDSGTRFYAGTSLISSGASVLNIVADQVVVAATGPFTPANGDTYRAEFDYICAP